MFNSAELLTIIFTIIGVGVVLSGSILTAMLVLFRMSNQKTGESEVRVTRLIEESEVRVTRLIEESEARLTRLIGESEARLTQRINSVEARGQRVEQETAEIKGALNVIQNALPLRIGE